MTAVRSDLDAAGGRDDDAPGPDAGEVAGAADRWALWVFGAAVVVAVPMFFVAGRDYWFFLDEWFLLVHDGLLGPGYLDGHNGHWVTFPTVLYRVNFWFWGLNAYWPYQVPVILLHTGSAVLLRVLMVRLGVRGWIATVVAVTFLFFGSGQTNILFGFQASLTGSLFFGLAVLLLADRDGPVCRWDGVALGLAVVGLTTSSAFVGLLIGMGVAVLLRRGWRVAAFYALPLGAVFGAWYLRYGADSGEPLSASLNALRFFGRMLWYTFESSAQTAPGAVVLGVAAAIAVVVAVDRLVRGRGAGSVSLLPALVVGWLVFAGLTALARADVPLTADHYSSDRYLHLGAALLLPLVAWGTEVLARRRLLLALVPVVALLAGLPGNVDRLFRDDPLIHHPLLLGSESWDILLALPQSEYFDQVPGDLSLVRHLSFFDDLALTPDWMADQVAAGRIPEPDRVDPETLLSADGFIVLEQGDDRDPGAACVPVVDEARLVLEPGGSVGFEGRARVSVTDGVHEGRERVFLSRQGSTFGALAGPVEVVVRPAPGEPLRLCPPAPDGRTDASDAPDESGSVATSQPRAGGSG